MDLSELDGKECSRAEDEMNAQVWRVERQGCEKQ